MLSAEKNESTASKTSKNEVASESKEGKVETPKQKLLDLIGGMKVEMSYSKKLQQLKTHDIKEQATDNLKGLDSEGAVPQRSTQGIQR